MSFGFALALTKPQTPLSAALDLAFAGATLSTFDPRITFTRGSGGGFFGSDGLYKWQGYNELLQSNQFDTTWTTTRVLTPVETGTSPVGDAWYVTLDATAAATHAIGQSLPYASGQTYTYSVYVKADTLGFFGIQLPAAAFTTAQQTVWNLETGATGGVLGTPVASRTVLSGGWQRLSLTATATATISANTLLYFTDSVSSTTVATPAGRGLYIAGAQLEKGSTASQYSPTTTAANSAPRLDYDPSTLLPRGLLVEEQRANLLLQSRDMTVTWTHGTGGAASRNQVGIDGVANSACTITNGTTGLGSFNNQSVTKAATTAYTFSVFAKKGSTNRIVLGQQYDGAGYSDNIFDFSTLTWVVTGAGSPTLSYQSIGGGWYRLMVTVTTIGTGSYANYCWAINNSGTTSSSTTSGDTVIVDCAQVEAGAFVTSPIFTTTASATRSADSASMTLTNFSSWYSQAQGTFVVEGDTVNSAPSATRRLFEADDGSALNRILVGFQSTTVVRGLVSTGGALQADINTSVTAAVVVKAALAYTLNDFATAANGVLGTVDASGTLPVVNQLLLGRDDTNSAFGTLNGHIRRIQYWPQRLGNSTLQALTS